MSAGNHIASSYITVEELLWLIYINLKLFLLYINMMMLEKAVESGVDSLEA